MVSKMPGANPQVGLTSILGDPIGKIGCSCSRSLKARQSGLMEVVMAASEAIGIGDRRFNPLWHA